MGYYGEDGRFAVKGRGAGLNPGNRFETVRLHVSGEFLDERKQEEERERETGAVKQLAMCGSTGVATQVFPDRTRTIINKVCSDLVPYDWTLNPYRGCEHGCIYCYARPYHEYLGMSCGLDFETKIVAKFDAARLLRRELAHPRWKPETIVMSAITDCWQPLEEKLGLARECLQVLAECRQPVNLLTKNHRLARDIDLLEQLNRSRAVHVHVTIITLDAKLASQLEPRASSPRERLNLIRELSRAKIPVSVLVAPIIPAITDRELPDLLEAVAEAGARTAGYVLLRLPYQLKEIFEDWLRRQFPDRADHVLSLLMQSFAGKLYDAKPELRMKGQGPVAEQIRGMFKLFAHRHGLDQRYPGVSGADFRRPELGGQMGLFTPTEEPRLF